MGCSGSTPPLRAAALVIAAVCLSLLASCTEELPAAGGLSGIGVVEGRVTEAGRPVPARVVFDAYQLPMLDGEFTAHADSSGWYHAELPLGLYSYRVSIDGASGPRISATDTVLVGRAVRRKDVIRGRAQVSLTLPAVYEGIDVWLDLATRGYSFSRSTSVQDGVARFDLRLLPAASYALRLSANSLMGDVLVSNDTNPALAESLRIVADTTTELAHDFRAVHCSLSGRVTGTPYLRSEWMRVEVLTATGHRRGTADCGTDGAFRLDLLTPEPVRLRARIDDIQQWFGGDSFANATVFDLQPGLHVAGVDLTGGGLRVAFEGPGDLVRNEASILVLEESGAEHVIYNSSDNPLAIENLRPGRVRLQVLGGCAGQPWQPQWYGGAAEAGDATYLDIVAGQMLDVAMTLTSGGCITGTLVSPGNHEIWGVDVALHDLDGQRLCPSSTFVRDGLMNLRGLRDGEYLLGLYLSSSPWWYPGTWMRNEAVPVSIVDGGTVSGLVWPLPFPYAKAAP